jgi:putative glutathione S-transferase
LPTAVRYDAVYGPLFRCSRARLADFPHLHAWLRDVARARGVRETVDVPGATASYFEQLFPLNPSGIIPAPPPALDLDSDPGRGPAGAEAVFHFRADA